MSNGGGVNSHVRARTYCLNLCQNQNYHPADVQSLRLVSQNLNNSQNKNPMFTFWKYIKFWQITRTEKKPLRQRSTNGETPIPSEITPSQRCDTHFPSEIIPSQPCETHFPTEFALSQRCDTHFPSEITLSQPCETIIPGEITLSQRCDTIFSPKTTLPQEYML